MTVDNYIGLIEDADIHDSRVLNIEQFGNKAIITLIDDNEFTFKLIFNDVFKIKSSNPNDIFIYAIYELKSLYHEYRYFIFSNSCENENAYLEIYAKSIEIDKTNREFIPRTRNLVRDLAIKDEALKEYGINYNPIETIEEARNFNDSYVIMEEGTYCEFLLICPLRMVRCTEKVLHSLLIVLVRKWNGSNITNAATIYYQRHNPGDRLYGESGFIKVKEDLWISKKIRIRIMKKKIRKVLSGEILSK